MRYNDQNLYVKLTLLPIYQNLNTLPNQNAKNASSKSTFLYILKNQPVSSCSHPLSKTL